MSIRKQLKIFKGKGTEGTESTAESCEQQGLNPLAFGQLRTEIQHQCEHQTREQVTPKSSPRKSVLIGHCFAHPETRDASDSSADKD
jgi:hypothetical protein